MKQLATLMVCATLVAIAAGPAASATLGGPAPALSVAEWVKNGPVDLAAGKDTNIFVVEFWATWCAPCRTSIPHLTELQKKYKDKGVVVVGISAEDAATVKSFVEQQGDSMDYAIAVDKGGETSAAYMEAFGVDGIPHAFLVDKKGNLVWHGHPMGELDGVLEAIVGGTFDPAQQEIVSEIKELMPLWCMEYLVLSKYGRDPKEADATAAKILQQGRHAPDMLNQLAWYVLTEENLKYRNSTFALDAAKLANDTAGGNSPAIMDTYARALFENGKKAEALEVQRKALAAAKMDPTLKDDAEMIGSMEKSLQRYEAGQ